MLDSPAQPDRARGVAVAGDWRHVRRALQGTNDGRAPYHPPLPKLFDKAYRRRYPGGMSSKTPKRYRKLTFADAQAIRAARAQNPALSLAALAGKFGVTVMTISRVLRGEVHREEKARKLTPREVQDLRYLARTKPENQSQEELAKQFGISQGEVSRIVSGELYADVPTGDRERALTEAIERAYIDLMASIPVVGLPGSQEHGGPPASASLGDAA